VKNARRPVAKLEQHRPVDTVVGVPHWTPSKADAGDARGGVLREMRELWPAMVDLAEQPGLLSRLDAMHNV
jgi:hypothetical protein